MDWDKAIKDYIATLAPVRVNAEVLQKIVQLMDLTSLNESDTESTISVLCEKAKTPFGHVAAICTYPAFVRLTAAEFSGTPIKIVTVANFPTGTAPIETVLLEIGQALEDGAQEMDIVFPYENFLAGKRGDTQEFVASCKAACGKKVVLKMILETGKLQTVRNIADASRLCFEAGADFIKTSTGKNAPGATLEAVATMLFAVREMTTRLNKCLGVKVSGGIRELEQAAQYILLAEKIMGPTWVCSQTFRLGSSQLINEIIANEAKV